MQSSDGDPDRRIPLERAFNFRDLGGYRGGDGKRVRWRQIFRADSLSLLTDSDHKVLKELSIATVVDLRTHAEVARSGRIRSSGAYLYHHLPMADVLPDTTDSRWSSPDFVASRYGDMLAGADVCMRETLTLAARPQSYPLVFHCAAGKDRTGIVALLILGLLGINRNDIIADYMLTQTAMIRMVDHWRTESPERAQQMQPHLPAITSTRAGNVVGLMKTIDEKYGSFERYSRHIGAAGSIPGMREILLSA
jgi:protein-tyrosine phosphatase